MSRRLLTLWPAYLALVVIPLQADETPAEKRQIDSFELIWSTLRDNYWDKTMGGLDWQAVHDRYLAQVKAAKTKEAARAAMSSMIKLLPSSHLAIIPSSLYKKRGQKSTPPRTEDKPSAPVAEDTDDDADDANETGVTGITVAMVEGQLAVRKVDPESGAAKAGVRPGWIIRSIAGDPIGNPNDWPGLVRESKDLWISQIVGYWLSGAPGSHVQIGFEKDNKEQVQCDITRQDPGELSTFSSFPPEHVEFAHRKLDSGVGYIALNLFLNPVKVMPEMQKAIAEFKDAPGIILDLRDNCGGIVGMAMGLAGWFIDKPHERLGAMTTRVVELKFSINPRLNNYQGKLAILVNGSSASTSEILAQGMHDLGRARIFGTSSAAAALPSFILDLPDGDRFQYPSANYTSLNGRVLEAHGVELDQPVELTLAALRAGHDEQIEKAVEWIKAK